MADSLRTNPTELIASIGVPKCGESNPRFDVEDDYVKLNQYLHKHGYCVVKGVASPDQLKQAEGLMWKHLEQDRGMKPDDVETWKVEFPDRVNDLSMSTGIVNTGEIHQSDFLWHVRTIPGIRDIYSRLWETQDLIVSYDPMGLFRPWHNPWLGEQYKTASGWFHIDLGARAHPLHRKAYPYQKSVPEGQHAAGEEALEHWHALQGLLCLSDQDESTGGLVVFPGSHKLFFEHVLPVLQARGEEGDEDFNSFQDDFELMQLLQTHSLDAKLVQAKAGDFIIWDSRTVHSNSPALRHPQIPEDRLLRAVAYVAMAPAAWASEAVLEYRRTCYERRQCTITGHMPHFPELLDEEAQKEAAIVRGVEPEVKRPFRDAPAAEKALVDPWYVPHTRDQSDN